ncbi:hypothetical protein NDN08_005123 [Rhodosorus marinus]|uniref:3-methyl-2-oxobutanoate hydroxymethyltransferase n=1 Tax=Rhodosorus marinus TaxID=101924 RepID=A0AAV8V0Z5_9RHOD|nr:hypothetical protein NDN08_005123 [Rhodosorus marinus]
MRSVGRWHRNYGRTLSGFRNASSSSGKGSTKGGTASTTQTAEVQSHHAPKAPATPRRLNISDIQRMTERGVPISVLTAYNYPSAVHADLAQMDMVLVGDSVAMVELGHETTQSVAMEEMLHHTKAVMRGTRRCLVIADMPFGSYQLNPEEAMRNAYRFIKETGVGGVKMEGGVAIKESVRRVVQGGIAVVGHTGLLPASVSAIGQYRSFGKNAKEAITITEDALALQDAGAFAIVLECIPERVAQFVTDKLDIPTIGIGAGQGTSGQVLVYHDVLGMLQHPHHAKVTPKFVKRYAGCAEFIQQGLETYKKEVKSRIFPSKEYCPYEIPDKEWEMLVGHFANTALVMPPRDLMKKKASLSKAKGKAKSTQKKARKSKTPIPEEDEPPLSVY